MVEHLTADQEIIGSIPIAPWFFNFYYLNEDFRRQLNKRIYTIDYYYYYSKKLSNSKDGKKKDNKGIKLIKAFIKNKYYSYGKIKGKKDE